MRTAIVSTDVDEFSGFIIRIATATRFTCLTHETDVTDSKQRQMFWKPKVFVLGRFSSLRIIFTIDTTMGAWL